MDRCHIYTAMEDAIYSNIINNNPMVSFSNQINLENKEIPMVMNVDKDADTSSEQEFDCFNDVCHRHIRSNHVCTDVRTLVHTSSESNTKMTDKRKYDLFYGKNNEVDTPQKILSIQKKVQFSESIDYITPQRWDIEYESEIELFTEYPIATDDIEKRKHVTNVEAVNADSEDDDSWLFETHIFNSRRIQYASKSTGSLDYALGLGLSTDVPQSSYSLYGNIQDSTLDQLTEILHSGRQTDIDDTKKANQSFSLKHNQSEILQGIQQHKETPPKETVESVSETRDEDDDLFSIEISLLCRSDAYRQHTLSDLDGAQGINLEPEPDTLNAIDLVCQELKGNDSLSTDNLTERDRSAVVNNASSSNLSPKSELNNVEFLLPQPRVVQFENNRAVVDLMDGFDNKPQTSVKDVFNTLESTVDRQHQSHAAIRPVISSPIIVNLNQHDRYIHDNWEILWNNAIECAQSRTITCKSHLQFVDNRNTPQQIVKSGCGNGSFKTKSVIGELPYYFKQRKPPSKRNISSQAAQKTHQYTNSCTTNRTPGVTNYFNAYVRNANIAPNVVSSESTINRKTNITNDNAQLYYQSNEAITASNTNNIQNSEPMIVTSEIGKGAFGYCLLVHSKALNIDKQNPLLEKEGGYEVNEMIVIKIDPDIAYVVWEAYIHTQIQMDISECEDSARQRLIYSQYFLPPSACWLYTNAAALLMPYANGKTLLDLINAMIAQKNTIGNEAFNNVNATTSSNTKGLHCKSPINRVDQEDIAAFLTKQMLEAIHFLHEHHVIHSDIKPNNWVIKWNVNGQGGHDGMHPYGIQLCLIDFGKAKQIQVNASNLIQIAHTMKTVGTYASDELLKHKEIQYIGNCAAKGMACPLQLSNKQWDIQPDYYGVASCMHNILYYAEMTLTTEHIEQVMRSRGFAECCLDFEHIIQTQRINVPKVSLKRYWNKELWSSLYIHLLNCNKKPNVIENLLKNDSYWTSNNQKCLTFDANTSSMMGNESQSEAPYASIPIYMYKLQQLMKDVNSNK